MQFQIGMSKSAYAKRRGVTPKAVRKAIASGRIAEAAYPGGSIDADLADLLWEQNTDPTQRRGAQAERAKASMEAAEADPETVEPEDEPEPAPAPKPARSRPSEPFREDPPRRRLPAIEEEDPLEAHLRRNRGEDEEEDPDAEVFGDNPIMLALAIKEKREKVRKLKLANDREEGSLVSRGPTWNNFASVLRGVSNAWQT